MAGQRPAQMLILSSRLFLLLSLSFSPITFSFIDFVSSFCPHLVLFLMIFLLQGPA